MIARRVYPWYRESADDENISAYVFGKRLEASVPERTRRDIADQQIESESLIGWVQLALVGVFAALYIFSPKTSAGTSFQPVPWALGAYLVFTVMRIIFAYRRILPLWLLMVSVVMDMGFLMSLIWSFHLQYEQPAPFYLKAPTMLYVFIFISLRAAALRGQVRHRRRPRRRHRDGWSCCSTPWPAWKAWTRSPGTTCAI